MRLLTDIEYLRHMAKQGNSGAMFELGLRYAKGNGVRKSRKNSIRFYLRGALMGDKNSMRNLGIIFEHGGGIIKKDLREAERWYERVGRELTSDSIVS